MTDSIDAAREKREAEEREDFNLVRLEECFSDALMYARELGFSELEAHLEALLNGVKMKKTLTQAQR